MANLLTKLRSAFYPESLIEDNQSADDNDSVNRNESLFSYSEIKEMIKTLYNKPVNNFGLDINDNYLNTKLQHLFDVSFYRKHTTIAKRIADAERVKKVAPEIIDAVDIISAIILSPDNMYNFTTKVVIDSPYLSPDENVEIGRFLSKHYEEQLNLSIKLNEWIKDIIGKSGAKPILILPYDILLKLKETDIINQIETTNSLTLSTERLIEQIASTDIYSNSNISVESLQEQIFSTDHIQDVVSSFETLIRKKLTIVNNDNEKLSTSIKKIFTSGMKKDDVFKYVSFVENPGILEANKLKTAIDKQRLDKKLEQFIEFEYKHSAVINLQDLLTFEDEKGGADRQIDGMPLLIELPTESVMPICVPNTTNHIGYFIMLDEYGTPISGTSDLVDEHESYISTKKNLLTKLEKAVYGSDYKKSTIEQQNKTSTILLNTVYESFLKKMMQMKLDNIGFDGTEFELSNDLMRVLSSRLLAKKKTRLLFVPVSLLTYFCFKKDTEGIGVSKIEDILFIISLRTTFLITSIMSMMEEAISSKELNISFDKNVTNPLELAEKIRQAYVEKRLLNFSYEPSKIVKTLAERETRVNFKNIPGLDNFDVESDDKRRTSFSSDSDLLDKLDNMIIQGLNLTPSIFNVLRDSEYSSSVVTNNLLLSLKIKNLQVFVIRYMSKFLRNYFKYCGPLKRKILEKIQVDDKKIDTKRTDHEKVILQSIENSIRIILPTVRIAFDKTIKEEISDFNDIVDNLAEKLYDDKLVPNEYQDSLNTMKAIFVRKMFVDYLKRSRATDEFDLEKLSEVKPDDLLEYVKRLTNTDALMKDFLAAIKKARPKSEEESSSGGSSW